MKISLLISVIGVVFKKKDVILQALSETTETA